MPNLSTYNTHNWNPDRFFNGHDLPLNAYLAIDSLYPAFCSIPPTKIDQLVIHMLESDSGNNEILAIAYRNKFSGFYAVR